MTLFWLAVIVFLAAIMQTLAGFGFALVVMPLVTLLSGAKLAGPLVALVGLTLYVVNLLRYRQAVQWGELWPLLGTAVPGIPLGIWLAATVDETMVQGILGALLLAYAIYALVGRNGRFSALPLPSPYWRLGAGFLAGCLGGAYNTPGPPVIVYGSLRQWPKDEFRAVLQLFFLVNGAGVVLAHGLAGHLETAVTTHYFITLLPLLSGVFVGSHLDGHIDTTRFRHLINWLILGLGASLFF